MKVLREPDYSNLDNPYLYGMPILFPVNRISNGSFEFEDRVYSFPINEPATGCHLHGFLHEAVFEVCEQGENYVKCIYNSDDLYEFFPHKFSVELHYNLLEDGLYQETYIYNHSDDNMPSFLGFHTTFNIPFVNTSKGDNVSVHAEISNEIERNMENYLPTGKIFSSTNVSERFRKGVFVSNGEPISKHYQASGEGIIELLDQEKNIKIQYFNDSQFGWRLFYNGNADSYICLEPQTCMVDCQNSSQDRTETGFDYIAPHTFKKYSSKITVTKL